MLMTLMMNAEGSVSFSGCVAKMTRGALEIQMVRVGAHA